jgi:hypothetical protein
LITTLIFFLLFLSQAINAWFETMKMITFLTRVKKEKSSEGPITSGFKPNSEEDMPNEDEPEK